ncbi:unnamed protein product [Diamesa serratosioi]
MFLINYLLTNFLFRVPEYDFKVYWGVPSTSCRKYQIDFATTVGNYGIIQNFNDSVRGDKIAIMYDPGEWPTIMKDEYGKTMLRNGGIPQNGSLETHLRELEIDFDRFIPNKTYDGLAVIDFECWRPSYRQNFGELKVYKDKSMASVSMKHPTWTTDQVQIQSKLLFENAASLFVNRTMVRAKKLRPNALWGYYGYPHCFNRNANDSHLERCPQQVESENDNFKYMYPDAVYPSIYITQNQTGDSLTKFVKGKLYETNRMFKLSGSKVKRLAFIRYQYTDTSNYLNNDDMQNILKTIKQEGAEGVILWGSSSQLKTE